MSKHHLTALLGFAGWIVLVTVSSALASYPLPQEGEAKNKPVAKVTFEDHIAPILKRRCSTCHNGDRREADLNVTNYVALMQGGGSGVVVQSGSADDSYLFRLVNHDDSPEMPPNGDKISDQEITLLRQWIETGALENVQSKARKSKPKTDFTILSGNPNKRPETIPTLPRLSLQPVQRTKRKPPIRSIAINPWAPIVAITGSKQVLLYDSVTLKLKGIIPFDLGQPETLRFSRNGSILLIGGGVAGDSGNVQLWDVAKGAIAGTIGEELDSVLACDISPDQSLVALGGPKKVLRVFSTQNGSLQYQIEKHTDWVTAIEFSPDGKNLASADRNGGLFIWDAQSGNENQTLSGHKQMITAVAWRSDGNVLGSISEDKSVRLWEMKKGKQLKSWEADPKGGTGIQFTPGGNVLTGGRSKLVKLWNQQGKLQQTFNDLKDCAMGLDYCEETQRVFAGSFNGEINVWDQYGKPIGELNSNPPTVSERLSAINGKLESAQKSLQNQQHALVRHDQSIDKLRTEVDLIKRKSANLNQKLADARTESATLRIEVESSQQTLKKLSAELKQPKHSQIDELVSRLEKRNKQISSWETNLAKQSDQLLTLQRQIGVQTKQRAPKKKKVETAAARVLRLQNAIKYWQDEAEFAR